MRTWITAAAMGASMLGGFGSPPVMAQTAPVTPPPGGPLSKADTDGDGVVTRDEARTEADRRFAEMDANHDGTIERDERRAFRDRHRPERRDDMPPPPPVGEDAPPPPPPHARDDGERRHHGRKPRVRDETQEQFRERALRMFDRADTNHDGRVDAQEREAMRLLDRARRIGGGDGDRRGPPPSPPAG